MSDERDLPTVDRPGPSAGEPTSAEHLPTGGGTAIRLLAAIAVLATGIVALVIAILLVRGVLA